MVKIAGEKTGSDALHPINLPVKVHVKSKDGFPAILYLLGYRRRLVVAIQDVWRVDEEWWRDCPIMRTYFDVLLEDGLRITLFFDHLSAHWYRQSYD